MNLVHGKFLAQRSRTHVTMPVQKVVATLSDDSEPGPCWSESSCGIMRKQYDNLWRFGHVCAF